MPAKDPAQYHRSWRARRRASGMCIQCGKVPPRKAKPGAKRKPCRCEACHQVQDTFYRARRAKLLADGICERCLSNSVIENQTKCIECVEKQNTRRKEDRRNGNCTICHRPVELERMLDGKGTCAHCASVNAIWKRGKVFRRVQQEVCIQCGTADSRTTEEGKTFCRECNAKARANNRRFQESRLARGLCGHCGKRPHKPTAKRCQECQDHHNEYRKGYRVKFTRPCKICHEPQGSRLHANRVCPECMPTWLEGQGYRMRGNVWVDANGDNVNTGILIRQDAGIEYRPPGGEDEPASVPE